MAHDSLLCHLAATNNKSLGYSAYIGSTSLRMPCTLSAGTLTLTQAQLAGLQMTVAEGDSFTLTVTSTTNDGRSMTPFDIRGRYP
jgi:hypothetical protein